MHYVVMLFRRVFIIDKLLPHFTSTLVCCVVTLAVWKAVQPHEVALLKIVRLFGVYYWTHVLYMREAESKTKSNNIF